MTKLYPSRYRSSPEMRRAFREAIEDDDDNEVRQLIAEFGDSFISDDHPCLREERAVYDRNRNWDRHRRLP